MLCWTKDALQLCLGVIIMLDKLPVVIWKRLLSHIYAAAQAESQVQDRSLVITCVLSLRQVCKYIKDKIITSAMCHWIMNNHRFNPSPKLIVAIPRHHGFIRLMWDATTNQANTSINDPTAYWSRLQWIRALSFTVAFDKMSDVFFVIENYHEFGWTVYLLDDVYDFSGIYNQGEFEIDHDLELIGLNDTKVDVERAIRSKIRCSLCVRNLYFNQVSPLCPVFDHYIAEYYDTVIVDHCVFEQVHPNKCIDVNCNRLAVVNCKFKDSYDVPIRYKYSLMYPLINKPKKHDRLVYVCNNRFENCQGTVKVHLEQLVKLGYDVATMVCLANNETL
ncbi:Hypothetical protein MVR_LOCUS410 [uncultured virus]|nr:Hypothetical protein MVR_LOCUS410 [uncultured virus]